MCVLSNKNVLRNTVSSNDVVLSPICDEGFKTLNTGVGWLKNMRLRRVSVGKYFYKDLLFFIKNGYVVHVFSVKLKRFLVLDSDTYSLYSCGSKEFFLTRSIKNTIYLLNTLVLSYKNICNYSLINVVALGKRIRFLGLVGNVLNNLSLSRFSRTVTFNSFCGWDKVVLKKRDLLFLVPGGLSLHKSTLSLPKNIFKLTSLVSSKGTYQYNLLNAGIDVDVTGLSVFYCGFRVNYQNLLYSYIRFKNSISLYTKEYLFYYLSICTSRSNSLLVKKYFGKLNGHSSDSSLLLLSNKNLFIGYRNSINAVLVEYSLKNMGDIGIFNTLFTKTSDSVNIINNIVNYGILCRNRSIMVDKDYNYSYIYMLLGSLVKHGFLVKSERYLVDLFKIIKCSMFSTNGLLHSYSIFKKVVSMVNTGNLGYVKIKRAKEVYFVPVIVNAKLPIARGIRWFVRDSRKGLGFSFPSKLYKSLDLILQGQGATVKRKFDYHQVILESKGLFGLLKRKFSAVRKYKKVV